MKSCYDLLAEKWGYAVRKIILSIDEEAEWGRRMKHRLVKLLNQLFQEDLIKIIRILEEDITSTIVIKFKDGKMRNTDIDTLKSLVEDICLVENSILMGK